MKLKDYLLEQVRRPEKSCFRLQTARQGGEYCPNPGIGSTPQFLDTPENIC